MFKNLSSNTTRSATEFRAFGPSVEAFENQMFVELLQKAWFLCGKACVQTLSWIA